MTGVAFEGLEPCEWKLSSTVLKGEGGRKAPDLPGYNIGRAMPKDPARKKTITWMKDIFVIESERVPGRFSMLPVPH